MKKIATALILAALLPLAGCATPYGYSSGAYAGYDGGFDSGYQGYGGGGSRYGYSEPGYNQMSDNAYYGGQAYAPPYGSGGYYAQPYGGGYYQQSYGGYGQPYQGAYYQHSSGPAYGPAYREGYSTYYGGTGY